MWGVDMSKRTGCLGWLYSHGVLIAYGVILSLVAAISTIAMLAVVLFVRWWHAVR